jgi:Zn-dependent M28 family amino/carboxypeptidase
MSTSDFDITPAALRARLDRIVGDRGPTTSASAARLSAVENYLEKELSAMGLRVESDFFSYRGRRFRNIVAHTSAQNRAPLVVLGAHFDCVEGSPGADDNASGVAVLLESARALSKTKLHSEVLFCAFNLEEFNMIGSSHLAKRLKSEGVNVAAMLSLEMLGYTDRRPGSQKYPPGFGWFYPDRADFIGVVGNRRSAALLKSFAAALKQIDGLPVETLSVMGNGFLVPQTRLSDHAPFWDAGFPALLVTDTAYMRNPNYHTAFDTIETLDFEFMAKVCRGVVNGVASL